MYSHTKSPWCCFSSVTRQSHSWTLRLGLIFNVFLESTSTRTLLELSITRINSVSLNKDSSISSSCSRYFSVLFRIWYARLVTDVGSLMKLKMVSYPVSILKVKVHPIFNKGWIYSYSSKSIHNGISTSRLGLAGGYKFIFLMARPSKIVMDPNLQLMYAFVVAILLYFLKISLDYLGCLSKRMTSTSKCIKCKRCTRHKYFHWGNHKG